MFGNKSRKIAELEEQLAHEIDVGVRLSHSQREEIGLLKSQQQSALIRLIKLSSRTAELLGVDPSSIGTFVPMGLDKGKFEAHLGSGVVWAFWQMGPYEVYIQPFEGWVKAWNEFGDSVDAKMKYRIGVSLEPKDELALMGLHHRSELRRQGVQMPEERLVAVAEPRQGPRGGDDHVGGTVCMT